jgi:hypothetical protein
MDDDSFFLLMNKKKMRNPHMFLNQDKQNVAQMVEKENVEEEVQEEPVDQNDEILEILKARMALGRERYGHGLRIDDDTRKWGTKEDSWEEMALEEILDGMIYTCCAILRLRKNRKDFENVEVVKNEVSKKEGVVEE